MLQTILTRINQLSIKAKLLLICSFLSTFVVGTGLIAFSSSYQVLIKYDRVAMVNIPSSKNLAEMRIAFRSLQAHLGQLRSLGATPKWVEDASKGIHESITKYEQAAKPFREIEFHPQQKELYQSVDAEWNQYKDLALRIVDLAKSKSHEDEVKLTTLYFSDSPESEGRFTQAMNRLITLEEQDSQAWIQKAKDAVKLGILLLSLGVISGFFIAMTSGYFMSSSITRAIQITVEQLSSSATQVAGTSTRISSSSEQLSSRANEQAAALQRTASSVEEMNAMVKKTAENSARSRTVASDSENTAHEGKKVVDEMIIAINEINQSNAEIMGQIEASNNEISGIIRVIGEIATKTKVIHDIVFQTKLLSFNASVEAARAGEHGKGFAVVAEEVGNLAQVSGNAAREIEEMLTNSIKKVEGIVANTKTKVESLVAVGKTKVNTGTAIANRCGEVLTKLVDDVSDVNRMVGEISVASDEQSKGIQEITQVMHQLDEVTRHNATASQEAAKFSENLAHQADILEGSVNQLRRTLDGGTAGESQTQNVDETPSSDMARAA
ncbi:methyl-accepting chemotaxis protein [Bdellovibrionota bacterium FG-1]